MKIAGGDLDYVQTNLCSQQCASLTVNQSFDPKYEDHANIHPATPRLVMPSLLNWNHVQE